MKSGWEHIVHYLTSALTDVNGWKIGYLWAPYSATTSLTAKRRSIDQLDLARPPGLIKPRLFRPV